MQVLMLSIEYDVNNAQNTKVRINNLAREDSNEIEKRLADHFEQELIAAFHNMVANDSFSIDIRAGTRYTLATDQE